jgi:hypothetical protein
MLGKRFHHWAITPAQNITMHWEIKKICVTYYGICFIAVVWNQTLNISEVYLYILQELASSYLQAQVVHN